MHTLTKLFRPLTCIALLALAFAACGGTPSDIESTDSALHDGNGMWIGGPNHLTGTYSCQGLTWTMKGDFDQAWSAPLGRYLSRVAQWTDIDTTRSEAMLSGCTNANEGSQFFMARSGSYVLYNISPKTCLLYTHAVGANSWTVGAGVTIGVADFQYVRPYPGNPNDRFQFTVVPTGGVGNPGVCNPITTQVIFSAP